ncbi:methyltransferase domain-containing protein [Chroococcidiopsis sp. TS-821]|uniref:methyltransferase domain-containing protein n=1 Tax=Chroococcidiopsis sp. TS-821 TaxID=1378066 RepID=UPI001AEF8DF6
MPNYQETDIRNCSLKNGIFDLVHARYVLIHLPNFQVALSRKIDLLKLGGWLVTEEELEFFCCKSDRR